MDIPIPADSAGSSIPDHFGHEVTWPPLTAIFLHTAALSHNRPGRNSSLPDNGHALAVHHVRRFPASAGQDCEAASFESCLLNNRYDEFPADDPPRKRPACPLFSEAAHVPGLYSGAPAVNGSAGYAPPVLSHDPHHRHRHSGWAAAPHQAVARPDRSLKDRPAPVPDGRTSHPHPIP